MADAKKPVHEQVRDQCYANYHAIGPVVSAFEALVSALEKYEEDTKNWPPLNLGLPHYRHAVKTCIEFREELRETGEGLGHVFRNKKP